MKSINVTIIGAGLMGHGIALKFALSKHKVTVFDPNENVLETLEERIKISLNQMDVPKLDRKHTLSLIDKKNDMALSLTNADLVIEAVPEKLSLKKEIFVSLEDLAPLDCIFASNTSVIPISKIVSNMKDKSRGLGTHWWNPPHLIPLVEVIKTKWTSSKNFDFVIKLLKDIGKTPVRVEKDVPGFIGNRLQHALWREAISLVENGVCDARSVDTVIKSSFGRRLSVLGPMENADLVGTDLTLDVHENVLFDIENSTKPSKLLIKLVKDGKLGMKTGEGFQIWTKEEMEETKQRVSTYLKRLENIL